jgi:hypothetical protein
MPIEKIAALDDAAKVTELDSVAGCDFGRTDPEAWECAQ